MYFYKTVMEYGDDNVPSNSVIQILKDALDFRKDEVEMQEPMSCGVVYDRWEEKVDDLDLMIGILEDLLCETEFYMRENLWNEFVFQADYHQFEYGGLKRLEL